MSVDPLDKTVNIGVIYKLYHEGLLKDNTLSEARKILRPALSWYAWANRILLFLGSALVLAGIIFFFAYNWSKMGKFLKFGLIEFCITGCIVASCYRSMNKIVNKILILSASVLTGTLLAVYGQTYQTGADAFELFRGWALLIFIWVAVSEFAALWFLWLVIVNTAIILFWIQAGGPTHGISYEWLCLTIASLNGLALILKELGFKYGMAWLKGKWLSAILLIAVLAFLSFPTLGLINKLIESNRHHPIEFASVPPFFVWIAAVACGYVFYRYKLRDIVPIAIITMDVCVVSLFIMGRIIFNHPADAGNTLLFALLILGVVTGAALWLKKVNVAMTAEAKEGDI